VAVPSVLLVERLSSAALVAASSSGVVTAGLAASQAPSTLLVPFGWLRNLMLVLAGLVTGVGAYALVLASIQAMTRR